jgi:hypothetical protein
MISLMKYPNVFKDRPVVSRHTCPHLSAHIRWIRRKGVRKVDPSHCSNHHNLHQHHKETTAPFLHIFNSLQLDSTFIRLHSLPRLRGHLQRHLAVETSRQWKSPACLHHLRKGTFHSRSNTRRTVVSFIFMPFVHRLTCGLPCRRVPPPPP